MSLFLSDEWFRGVNERLRAADPSSLTEPLRQVALVFSGTPDGLPAALTLNLGDGQASVTPGQGESATTRLRLAYDDALAVSDGTLDSAVALREGQIKVSGDVTTLVAMMGWLQSVFATAG